MICFQCEDEDRDRRGNRYWPIDTSVGNWLIHRLAHSAPDFLILLVTRVGILDAEREGGEIFWRWDPWNGIQRKVITTLRKKVPLKGVGAS